MVAGRRSGCPPRRPGPIGRQAPRSPPRRTRASSHRSKHPRRRTWFPSAPTGRRIRRPDRCRGIGPRPGVHLTGQLSQTSQVHPGPRGADQDRVCGITAVRGELVRPLAHGAGERLRYLPLGQRLRDLRVSGGTADPGGVRHGGAFDPGPIDQPCARTLIRVNSAGRARWGWCDPDDDRSQAGGQCGAGPGSGRGPGTTGGAGSGAGVLTGSDAGRGLAPACPVGLAGRTRTPATA